MQTRNNREKQRSIQSHLDWAKQRNDHSPYDDEQAKLLAILKSLDGKPAKAYETEILKRKSQLLLDQASPNRNFYSEVVDKSIIDSLEKVYGKPVKPKAKFVIAKDSRAATFRPDSSKLVYMTPEQYLSLATQTHHYDKSSITNLQNRMLNKQEIDPLWFDVDVTTRRVTGHEGRHRALVAQMLGLQKVPVVLYAREGNSFTSKSKLPTIDKLERQLD